MNPEDRYYHKEHTWAKISGKRALVGITEHAQNALGDIVFIDLPEVESMVEAGVEVSEIESTKATSAVISPLTGIIIRINEDLDDTPEIINEEPYDKGWIYEIEVSDALEMDDLMEASDYSRCVEEEDG